MTDPLLVGLLAVVVGAIAVGRPSFWGDEAATISASTRSLPDLARLVSSVDAVHTPYYWLMHGWFLLAPPTEALVTHPELPGMRRRGGRFGRVDKTVGGSADRAVGGGDFRGAPEDDLGGNRGTLVRVLGVGRGLADCRPGGGDAAEHRVGVGAVRHSVVAARRSSSSLRR